MQLSCGPVACQDGRTSTNSKIVFERLANTSVSKKYHHSIQQDNNGWSLRKRKCQTCTVLRASSTKCMQWLCCCNELICLVLSETPLLPGASTWAGSIDDSSHWTCLDLHASSSWQHTIHTDALCRACTQKFPFGWIIPQTCRH